jgi:purine-binding chemotaxis protein CheW
MNAADAYVLFRIDGQEAALARIEVTEILPTARLDRPVGAPRALAGFLNLAGQPLAVLRLGTLIGATTDTPQGDDLYSHIIRLRDAPGRPSIGLLVDRVIDAAAVAQDTAAAPSDDSLNGCVAQTLTIQGRFVPRLATERLLLAQEALRLEEMSLAITARLADWTPA